MFKTILVVNIEIPHGKVCNYNIVTVANSPLYLSAMCGKTSNVTLPCRSFYTTILLYMCNVHVFHMQIYMICLISQTENLYHPHLNSMCQLKIRNFHKERNLLMKSNLMNFRVNFSNFNVIEG